MPAVLGTAAEAEGGDDEEGPREFKAEVQLAAGAKLLFKEPAKLFVRNTAKVRRVLCTLSHHAPVIPSGEVSCSSAQLHNSLQCHDGGVWSCTALFRCSRWPGKSGIVHASRGAGTIGGRGR